MNGFYWFYSGFSSSSSHEVKNGVAVAVVALRIPL